MNLPPFDAKTLFHTISYHLMQFITIWAVPSFITKMAMYHYTGGLVHCCYSNKCQWVINGTIFHLLHKTIV